MGTWELPCPEEPDDFGPLLLFISLTFAMLTLETMSNISFPLTITYDLVQYFTFVLLVTLVPGINDSLEEPDQGRDQTVNRMLYVCQTVVLRFPRITEI